MMYTNIIDSSTGTSIGIREFLICVVAALILGLITALANGYKSTPSRSFAITLATLPAIVTVVIMMVNGNLGAGVAVAGAFSLVRFRSAQGSAREIAAIFLAMATGLITGMGYVGYAALFTLIMCAVLMIYTVSGFGSRASNLDKTLRITIPEDLDYTGVFDEIFDIYTSKSALTSVKTTGKGCMFKLKYDVTLREGSSEKEFIDKLRERNGNLEIAMSSREITPTGEL